MSSEKNNKKIVRLAALFFCLCIFNHASYSIERPATIVLILDDMGNSLTLGEKALQLPGAINYAFLPHSPNSIILAEKAHQLNKEVMLHAPMSNIYNRPIGPGGLTPDMDQQQFLNTLDKAINSIPHVKGVNNHMGSLLTQLPKPMAWLMRELKQRQLYFVDSRTSNKTIAAAQAKNYQLPHLHRDIFLDHSRDPASIARQFEKLLSQAKSHGIAVGIGHPHPETLAFLEHALPSLKLRGYKLDFVSNVIAKKNSHHCATNGERLWLSCDTGLTLSALNTRQKRRSIDRKSLIRGDKWATIVNVDKKPNN